MSDPARARNSALFAHFERGWKKAPVLSSLISQPFECTPNRHSGESRNPGSHTTTPPGNRLPPV
jgi:hypothetical protein